MESNARVQRGWHSGQGFAGTRELRLNKFDIQVGPWIDSDRLPRRIWKLIPAKVENTSTPSPSSSENLGSGPLPSYDEDATGQSSARARHTEFERDEFGTIVNEVTVVTTNSTVTTHKRYRAEGA